jgi:hypothetical protein
MLLRTQFGHPVLNATPILTLAALKALDVTEHFHGERFMVGVNTYYYHSTSALTGDDIFVVAPTTGAGRYLLAPGAGFDIAVAIAFGTADAAILATVPTGARLMIGRNYWEVTADFTGGSSSAIGLSSSATGFSTKGDLLGGSGGDVAATLVASAVYAPGTVGAKSPSILKAASTVRFDRITSAFTAGTGFAHIVGVTLANAGA